MRSRSRPEPAIFDLPAVRYGPACAGRGLPSAGCRRGARSSTRSRSGPVPHDAVDREAAGQRVAQARRRRGLSQAVLAGLVGRSESWLSQLERGKRGVDSHSVLVHLSEVLRVDIEEFTRCPG
jgi:ribosome-binding protein aMBF1 (putative translation factor)